MDGMSTLSECVSSFSTYPRKDEDVVAYTFNDASDGHRLMTRLETLECSQFVSPRFSTKVQNWYHVVVSSRNGDSIIEWCEKNYERFWKLSRDNDGKYNIISLSEVAKKLFRNILQGLKLYHDAKSGHGNLANGVMVTPDGEITFFNEDFASLENPMGFEMIMAEDVKSFRVLFEDAMTTVGQRLAELLSLVVLYTCTTWDVSDMLY
ncbi:hypothetical protein RHGRI_016552 [Rhododendron griersonianum]|uniref:Protein kinase domain-containing protein n=1 Tax=Rhododendron griersonianum TaxID=479676 RepID=A0AAV6JUI4_9ERIC|nr:hypothetical protein RHGRI_016552 [Rhododendron griersonianum]